MQLKRPGPAPSRKLTGGRFVCPPPSTTGAPAAIRTTLGGKYMSILSRPSLLTSALLASLLPTASFGADKPSTINIDWATYNPVSMVLKDKGWLEQEFEKDGI